MEIKRARAAAFFRAALVVSVVAACAGLPSVACGEKRGGLMLAVTTDMRAPKDVNVVSVTIQVGPQIKYNFVGRVTPEGEVLLPATLMIVQPEDPNAIIKVRVIAFKDSKPRVLRDITTTAPRDSRIALLRLPLSFVNDESATGVLKQVPNKVEPKSFTNSAGAAGAGAAAIFPQDIRLSDDEFNPFGTDVIPVCGGIDETMIEGECASSKVEESTLPDFDQALVTRPDNKCFHCRDCFDGWREVDVDLAACTVAKEGLVTNVGLITATTGDCNENGKCFVPIDKSTSTAPALDGWREEGNTIRLLKGTCKKIREGAKLALVSSTACESKTASFPVCVGPSGAPLPDGGAPQDAAADAADASVDPWELIVPANNPSAVAAFADRTYFGSTEGVFIHRAGEKNGTPLTNSPAGPIAGPWFISQLGTSTLALAHGTPFAVSGDTRGYYVTNQTVMNPITFLASASIGSVVNGVAATPSSVVVPPGRIFFAVSDPVSSGGDIHHNDFACCGTQTTGGFGNSTAVAYAEKTNQVLTGGAGGVIHIIEPEYFDVDAYVDSDPAAVKAVEGLAAAASVPAMDGVRAFALRQDGIFFINKPLSGTLTSTPAIKVDLTGIMNGGVYHPRGLAAYPSCAFYASSKGVEYVSADGKMSGVLADMGGAPVLGVAAPILPGATQQHVYFAVHQPSSSKGGIWRVKVPPACTP